MLYRTGIDVLIIGVGSMAGLACDVAQLLDESGFASTVVDPVVIKPLPRSIVNLAASVQMVVSIEDGILVGGVGAAISDLLETNGVHQPRMSFGVRDEFLVHSPRPVALAEQGLRSDTVAAEIQQRLAQLHTRSG